MKTCLMNETKKLKLLSSLEEARSTRARLKGLLGKKEISPDFGLHITYFNSIHTFFMKFSIDVLFVDRSSRVIEWLVEVPPGRLVFPRWRAHSVIECAAGKVTQWEKAGWLEKGDILNVGH